MPHRLWLLCFGFLQDQRRWEREAVIETSLCFPHIPAAEDLEGGARLSHSLWTTRPGPQLTPRFLETFRGNLLYSGQEIALKKNSMPSLSTVGMGYSSVIRSGLFIILGAPLPGTERGSSSVSLCKVSRNALFYLSSPSPPLPTASGTGVGRGGGTEGKSGPQTTCCFQAEGSQ